MFKASLNKLRRICPSQKIKGARDNLSGGVLGKHVQSLGFNIQYGKKKKKEIKLGVVAQACNHSPREAEAGGLL